MAIRTHRYRILGAPEQVARARIVLRNGKAYRRGGAVRLEATVRPTPLSQEYHVRIEYSVGSAPDVWVLSPPVKPREDGEPIPHMYDQERLCLYLPGEGEWSGEMSLAHTVLPWVSLWLFYYEIWHATGKWLGGGIEPTAKPPVRRDKQYLNISRKRPK